MSKTAELTTERANKPEAKEMYGVMQTERKQIL